MSEKINLLLADIGLRFQSLWNRRRIVLPFLLFLSLLGWAVHLYVGALITFDLAVTLTVLFLAILLIGTVVIGGVEDGSIPLDRVSGAVAGTLTAMGIVLAVLIYLAAMLSKVLPPPPLPILFAILFAMEVAPFVTLFLVIPPAVGYFVMRDRWNRLRRRIPFWGAYLGMVSALLFVYPILRYPELWFYGGLKFFAIAGATLLCSVLLVVHPREGTFKAMGLALPLLGFLSWFVCFGGMTLGSVLAILAGACSFSFKIFPDTGIETQPRGVEPVNDGKTKKRRR